MFELVNTIIREGASQAFEFPDGIAITTHKDNAIIFTAKSENKMEIRSAKVCRTFLLQGEESRCVYVKGKVYYEPVKFKEYWEVPDEFLGNHVTALVTENSDHCFVFIDKTEGEKQEHFKFFDKIKYCDDNQECFLAFGNVDDHVLSLEYIEAVITNMLTDTKITDFHKELENEFGIHIDEGAISQVTNKLELAPYIKGLLQVKTKNGDCLKCLK